jgi:hypothetical protein
MSLLQRYQGLSSGEQKALACGLALAMIGGSIAIRGAMDGRSEHSPPSIERIVPTPEALPATVDVPPVIVVPEIALNDTLRRGSMEQNALTFGSTESLSVMCERGSALEPGEQPARVARGAWPLQIADAAILYNPNAPDISEPLLFFGEEIGRNRNGQKSLGKGMALGFDRLTGRYNLYAFQVGRSRDQGIVRENIPGLTPIGEAFSGLVASLSLAELTERPFRYDRIQLVFDVDDSQPRAPSLIVILSCTD